jgi:hypothetical protein
MEASEGWFVWNVPCCLRRGIIHGRHGWSWLVGVVFVWVALGMAGLVG